MRYVLNNTIYVTFCCANTICGGHFGAYKYDEGLKISILTTAADTLREKFIHRDFICIINDNGSAINMATDVLDFTTTLEQLQYEIYFK